MTRDEIAVACLQGLIAGGHWKNLKRSEDQSLANMGLAAEAYDLADSMLAERELSAADRKERSGK